MNKQKQTNHPKTNKTNQSNNTTNQVLDAFLDILRDSSKRRFHKEVFVMLNQLLTGAKRHPSAATAVRALSPQLSIMLDEYLQPSRWSLPTHVSQAVSVEVQQETLRCGLSL